jgi:hypothetical protein
MKVISIAVCANRERECGLLPRGHQLRREELAVPAVARADSSECR